MSDKPAEVTPDPENMTQLEKDRQWVKEVYQGNIPQLTVRAIITGLLLGWVMALANLYVGLKSGWGIGVEVTSVILAFAIWKGIEGIRLTKRPLHMLENNIIMTSAVTPSYIVSAGLVSSIPAMMMLDPNFSIKWWQLAIFLQVTLLLGMIVAVPIKRQIVNSGELPFPAAIPTAETLKSIYSKGAGAMQKAASLFVAALIGVADQVLVNVGIMTAFITSGALRIGKIGMSKLTLGMDTSLLFVGIGAFIGPRIGLTMLVGMILNFAVLGPWMIHKKEIVHDAPALSSQTILEFPMTIPAGSELAFETEEAINGPEMQDGTETLRISKSWVNDYTYTSLDELLADLNGLLIHPSQIANPMELVTWLNAGDAPLAAHLKAHLSEATLAAMEENDPEFPPGDELIRSITTDLNATLFVQGLYNASWFPCTSRLPETTLLLETRAALLDTSEEKDLNGQNLITMNRLLLDEGLAGMLTGAKDLAHDSENSLPMVLHFEAGDMGVQTGENPVPLLPGIPVKKIDPIVEKAKQLRVSAPELTGWESKLAVVTSADKFGEDFNASLDAANSDLSASGDFVITQEATALALKKLYPENMPVALMLGFLPDDAHGTSMRVVGGYRNIVAWTMWPAVGMMVMAGLLAFAFQYKTIAHTFKGLFAKKQASADGEEEDPLDGIEIPMKWFVIGFIIFGILAIITMLWIFDIPIWMGIIAVIMSFFLAMVAVRASGETGIIPIGAMGKVTQLTFGVLHPGSIKTNLMTASVTAGAATSAGDMCNQLKVGHLIGAKARHQFIAQMIGIISSIAVVPVFFIMVPDRTALGTAALPAPSAVVWAGVARLLSQGIDTLPKSAVVALAVGSLFGVAIAFLEKLYPKCRRWVWLPSPAAMGIAMIVPAQYSLSMFIGAMAALILEKVAPKTNDMYTIPVASGFIAGEALTGVAIAIIAVLTGGLFIFG